MTSRDGSTGIQGTTSSGGGGGSGGGVSITPIAFLVVNQSGVELKHIEERTSLYERLLDQAPKVINSIMNEFDKSGIKSSQGMEGKNE